LADTPSASGALPKQGDRANNVIAIVTSADGVRHVDPANTVNDIVAAERLRWIDIVTSDSAAQTQLFHEVLGLDPAEQAWMQRFGQAGRMLISEHKIRAATWLVAPGAGLSEFHLLCIDKTILTLWHGDPRALDLIRSQFAARAGELEGSHHRAAAILLQFLLATLYQGVGDVDDRLERLTRNCQTWFAQLGSRVERAGSAAIRVASVRTLQQRSAIGGDWYRGAAKYGPTGGPPS
jgi:hypothetical protein